MLAIQWCVLRLDKHESDGPSHFENSVKMLCKISRVQHKSNLSTATFPCKLPESFNIWNFKTLVQFYNYSRERRGKALPIVISIS